MTKTALPLLMGVQLLAMGCSPEAKELWADDLAQVTRGKVALASGQSSTIASKTGLDLTQKATPPANAQPYALDGVLSKDDVTALFHLSWPQSYEAISGRLGFPAYRDETADYYQLPNGHWAAIYYTDTTATGYGLSDSGE